MLLLLTLLLAKAFLGKVSFRMLKLHNFETRFLTIGLNLKTKTCIPIL